MKAVILYAALLGAAMVGSYVSWTAEDTGSQSADEVSIYRAVKGDVEKVSFTSEDVDVTVERRTDARGEYAWIEVVERKKTLIPPPPKPEADPDEAGPKEDGSKEDGEKDDGEKDEEPEVEDKFDIEVVKQSFVGSPKALALLESFEPLQAKRELDATLATTPSFGFDEPEGTIVVKRKKGEEKLVLGGSTYGSKDRYLMAGERLFLVVDSKTRPLRFAATRLRERRPHPWRQADLDQFAVTRDGKSLSFDQKNRDDRKKAFWASQGEDTEDETIGTLIEKVMRLKVSNKPLTPEGDLVELLSFSLKQGKEVWVVKVQKDASEDGRFLTSDFLRSTVAVGKSAIDEIVADLDELLSE